MASDFSKPQRQSAIGIVVVFLYSLQKILRAIWPIAIVTIFRINQSNFVYYFLGLILTLSILAIISYLQFINFTFYIDNSNNEFIIQEGVFNKTKTTIGLDKIQQININQSFIQKLVNVYELQFDTAGSSTKEGKIKAISHELASSLKAKLLENESLGQGLIENLKLKDAENPITNETQPIIKIGLTSLIKIGITANYAKSISLLLVLAITIFDNFRQLTDGNILDGDKIETAVSDNFNFNAIAIFVIALFSIVIIVNLVTTIFKYFDLSILKQKGSIVLSHGLLNSKSTIIKPEKVQIVYHIQNYFQRKIDVSEIEIKQGAADQTSKSNMSKIKIPGCNTSEKDQIYNLLYNDIPMKGEQLLPNFRKLGFSVFLFVLLPVSIYVIIGNIFEESLFLFKNYVIVYAMIVPIVLFINFKNYKLFIHENYIIKQSGLWDITTEIVMPDKIQAVKTSQLFWHKNLNIGSITIYTAGGKLSFDLGNFSILKQKTDLWLHYIESQKNYNL